MLSEYILPLLSIVGLLSVEPNFRFVHPLSSAARRGSRFFFWAHLEVCDDIFVYERQEVDLLHNEIKSAFLLNNRNAASKLDSLSLLKDLSVLI